MPKKHTNGGLSINRRQLFNSVGELSSSELADRDGIFCILVISQLQIKRILLEQTKWTHLEL